MNPRKIIDDSKIIREKIKAFNKIYEILSFREIIKYHNSVVKIFRNILFPIYTNPRMAGFYFFSKDELAQELRVNVTKTKIVVNKFLDVTFFIINVNASLRDSQYYSKQGMLHDALHSLVSIEQMMGRAVTLKLGEAKVISDLTHVYKDLKASIVSKHSMIAEAKSLIIKYNHLSYLSNLSLNMLAMTFFYIGLDIGLTFSLPALVFSIGMIVLLKAAQKWLAPYNDYIYAGSAVLSIIQKSKEMVIELPALAAIQSAERYTGRILPDVIKVFMMAGFRYWMTPWPMSLTDTQLNEDYVYHFTNGTETTAEVAKSANLVMIADRAHHICDEQGAIAALVSSLCLDAKNRDFICHLVAEAPLASRHNGLWSFNDAYQHVTNPNAFFISANNTVCSSNYYGINLLNTTMTASVFYEGNEILRAVYGNLTKTLPEVFIQAQEHINELLFMPDLQVNSSLLIEINQSMTTLAASIYAEMEEDYLSVTLAYRCSQDLLSKLNMLLSIVGGRDESQLITDNRRLPFQISHSIHHKEMSFRRTNSTSQSGLQLLEAYNTFWRWTWRYRDELAGAVDETFLALLQLARKIALESASAPTKVIGVVGSAHLMKDIELFPSLQGQITDFLGKTAAETDMSDVIIARTR